MCNVFDLDEYRTHRLPPLPPAGELLKLQREAQGVSRENLAGLLAVSVARIEAFEAGNSDDWLEDAIEYALEQIAWRVPGWS